VPGNPSLDPRGIRVLDLRDLPWNFGPAILRPADASLVKPRSGWAETDTGKGFYSDGVTWLQLFGAGAGGHVVQDEGISLPNRPLLDFAGEGVVATDEPGKTLVTIGGVTSGSPSLSSQILALTDLGAFWKLNEPAGSAGTAVVADSSGNGHPLSAQDIVFGALAGPPGETTAEFTLPTSIMDMPTAWAPVIDDFTAFGWVRLTTGHYASLCGTGPSSLHSVSNQWQLAISNVGPQLALHINGTTVAGTATIPVGVWTMWAVKRAAGTWSMYVDGAVEANHATTTPTGPNIDWFLGHDRFTTAAAVAGQLQGRLSYCALVRRALTDAEIVGLAAAGGPEPAGKVFSADGAAGTLWDWPTLETRLNGA
jgi:hypothetical protein